MKCERQLKQSQQFGFFPETRGNISPLKHYLMSQSISYKYFITKSYYRKLKPRIKLYVLENQKYKCKNTVLKIAYFRMYSLLTKRVLIVHYHCCCFHTQRLFAVRKEEKSSEINASFNIFAFQPWVIVSLEEQQRLFRPMKSNKEGTPSRAASTRCVVLPPCVCLVQKFDKKQNRFRPLFELRTSFSLLALKERQGENTNQLLKDEQQTFQKLAGRQQQTASAADDRQSCYYFTRWTVLRCRRCCL